MNERAKNVLRGILGILISSQLSACRPPSRETVEIPAGKALVGRTLEEIETDYFDCQEMVKRTKQAESICEPKEEVFGDVPQREVKTAGFLIDKYEQHDKNGLPKLVSFQDARDACEERRGRLPTKDEWEVAARGQSGSIYPWGNEIPEPGDANIDALGGNPNRPIQKVGSYTLDVTPEGAFDMVGNVREWTTGQFREPVGKGGNAGAYIVFAKPAQQIFPPPGSKLGFRCVYPK